VKKIRRATRRHFSAEDKIRIVLEGLRGEDSIASSAAAPGLFLAVLLSMSLHGLFSMPSAMNYVAPCGVRVVCRLFVMSGIVVLGGLLVVTGSMLKMF
jgi:hypothetical protein